MMRPIRKRILKISMRSIARPPLCQQNREAWEFDAVAPYLLRWPYITPARPIIVRAASVLTGNSTINSLSASNAKFGSDSTPKHLDRIFLEIAVSRQQHQTFRSRLSDQHSVKWISVIIWQPFQCRDMAVCNIQRLQGHQLNRADHKFRGALWQHQLSSTGFDCNFPGTCG